MSEILWEPDSIIIEQSRMFRFLNAVNKEFSLSLKNYSQLHQWSIEHYKDFWSFYSSYSGIKFHNSSDRILSQDSMPGGKWFEGAELNYAENLLQGPPEKIALISKVESLPLTTLTFGELKEGVVQFASALIDSGVKQGDCIAGYLPNISETMIAMLGCASIGAIWTSCSPDFGIQGVIDRFGQIQPKLLISSDGYPYNGQWYSLEDRIATIIEKVNSIQTLVLVPLQPDPVKPDHISVTKKYNWNDFLSKGSTDNFLFKPLPFNHPLFILYSSGTTGLPKCIVHGTGTTLIQHHKEHALHTNISNEDVVFYYTTCGWMMWNWLASVLAQQATIVLYEGSPAYPSLNVLWELIDEAQISVFGTSPKFLSLNQKSQISPKLNSKLSSLKTILSTGSPLSENDFYWVYENVKSNVQLSSICGGTDIVSCFMLGNPMLPVRAGEIQSLGLGMDVLALDVKGSPTVGKKGELVCRTPVPSMPIYFWNDPDQKKYFQSYFSQVPGMWSHGDFIEIKRHGGIIVYGRSDATLNPGGVRIGTGEIYRVVDSIEEVIDSLVIGIEEENDIQVILFVVLQEGCFLDDLLKIKIRTTLKNEASPRHIPREIYQVNDIPRTLNGKKMELCIKNLFEGKPMNNYVALSNPDCLRTFKKIKTIRVSGNKK